MIEVNNLVKEFDGFRALDGTDMHVKKRCYLWFSRTERSRKINTDTSFDRYLQTK